MILQILDMQKRKLSAPEMLSKTTNKLYKVQLKFQFKVSVQELLRQQKLNILLTGDSNSPSIVFLKLNLLMCEGRPSINYVYDSRGLTQPRVSYEAWEFCSRAFTHIHMTERRVSKRVKEVRALLHLHI